MEPTFEDVKRALGDQYSTEHGNRFVCPMCHDKSLTLNKGNKKWLVKCWHRCDQDTLANTCREMAGGTSATTTAIADNEDETRRELVPYTVAAYAKDKIDVPEDWLRDNFDVKDTLFWKVPCVSIPWPDGSTTQFRFGDGHKKFKARSHPGLYVPPYHEDFVSAENADYCFITEGASNTHTLSWVGQPVVGAPSGNVWKPAFAWDDAFDACEVIYALQDPPHRDPTKPDTGREFVQKSSNSMPDKKVYAVKLWKPDGKGYYTGPKDANELWLSTSDKGNNTEKARLQAYTDMLSVAVANAELVLPEKSLEWGKPGTWENQLPAVPPFKVEYLPQCLRALVQDVAERLSCPPDFPAAACITALAGVVGRRAHVQPKQYDKEWRPALNLWGAIVAEPGQMKTPVYNAITAAHVAVQRKWAKENEEKQQAWAAKSEEERATGTKPKHHQLFTNDTTYEALQDRMVDNPQGIFYLRDEMMGWVADLEKQGHESDRSFFLTAWSGGYYTADRIGRGHLECWVCLSKFGSFQPTRLKEFLLKGVEDGLFQREQVLVWPDFKPFRNVDKTANRAAIDDFARVIAALADLPEYAMLFDFDAEAQLLFNTWLENITASVASETYAPKIQHLTKYRSLMPILAALFQLADTVAGPLNHPLAGQRLIDADHTRQAIAYCSYLAGHLNRVYSVVPQEWQVVIKELALRLQNGEFGLEFTTRDVLRKGWRGLGNRQAVERALTELEVKDWLRRGKHDHKSTGLGGDLRSKKWLVNPAVFEGDQ